MLQPVGFGKANKGIPAFGVAFGWIRRRPDGQGNPCKHQIVSGGLIPLPRPSGDWFSAPSLNVCRCRRSRRVLSQVAPAGRREINF